MKTSFLNKITIATTLVLSLATTNAFAQSFLEAGTKNVYEQPVQQPSPDYVVTNEMAPAPQGAGNIAEAGGYTPPPALFGNINRTFDINVGGGALTQGNFAAQFVAPANQGFARGSTLDISTTVINLAAAGNGCKDYDCTDLSYDATVHALNLSEAESFANTIKPGEAVQGASQTLSGASGSLVIDFIAVEKQEPVIVNP